MVLGLFMDIQAVFCFKYFFADTTFVASVIMVNFKMLLHVANVQGHFLTN